MVRINFFGRNASKKNPKNQLPKSQPSPKQKPVHPVENNDHKHDIDKPNSIIDELTSFKNEINISPISDSLRNRGEALLSKGKQILNQYDQKLNSHVQQYLNQSNQNASSKPSTTINYDLFDLSQQRSIKDLEQFLSDKEKAPITDKLKIITSGNQVVSIAAGSHTARSDNDYTCNQESNSSNTQSLESKTINTIELSEPVQKFIADKIHYYKTLFSDINQNSDNQSITLPMKWGDPISRDQALFALKKLSEHNWRWDTLKTSKIEKIDGILYTLRRFEINLTRTLYAIINLQNPTADVTAIKTKKDSLESTITQGFNVNGIDLGEAFDRVDFIDQSIPETFMITEYETRQKLFNALQAYSLVKLFSECNGNQEKVESYFSNPLLIKDKLDQAKKIYTTQQEEIKKKISDNESELIPINFSPELYAIQQLYIEKSTTSVSKKIETAMCHGNQTERDTKFHAFAISACDASLYAPEPYYSVAAATRVVEVIQKKNTLPENIFDGAPIGPLNTCQENTYDLIHKYNKMNLTTCEKSDIFTLGKNTYRVITEMNKGLSDLLINCVKYKNPSQARYYKKLQEQLKADVSWASQLNAIKQDDSLTTSQKESFSNIITRTHFQTDSDLSARNQMVDRCKALLQQSFDLIQNASTPAMQARRTSMIHPNDYKKGL